MGVVGKGSVSGAIFLLYIYISYSLIKNVFTHINYDYWHIILYEDNISNMHN